MTSVLLAALTLLSASVVVAAVGETPVSPRGSSAMFPDCSLKADGHYPYNGTLGPFGKPAVYTMEWEERPIVAMVPDTIANGPAAFPLVIFMHGSTGQIEMYTKILEGYASHGFVVIFPYIKSPEGDKKPLTTNTNGEYLLKAAAFANYSSTSNASSPLYTKVDMTRIVLSGHSMGATCSIMAAQRAIKGDARIVAENVRLVTTQHPGICGPIGPPPWPDTWLKGDLRQVLDSYPMLFTTATNDGAFWPAPHTAEHELGCFKGGANKLGAKPAAFVQFSTAACLDDGTSGGAWSNGGHDCSMKSSPEAPWVLTAMKLYAQQDGNLESQCAQMLYGKGPGTLQADTNTNRTLITNNPKS